ncbi:MAG: 5-carboxymethyl-2-hydroxymuconate isomerase, partial [Nitrospira sp. SB0667_bin_9]|nr:5-carboxymethyl-2-hydroxymuconate isomerase [Nitrospira sp. SB0667_bin_9]
MKIVRFQDPAGNVHYGEWIKEWSALLIEKTVDGIYQVTDHVVAIDRLLAPVELPSILCVGLNYRRHAEETGAKIPEHPVLFIKAVNALAHPGDPIVIPRVAPGQGDCEGEMAVVIGKPGKNIERRRALDH